MTQAAMQRRGPSAGKAASSAAKADAQQRGPVSKDPKSLKGKAGQFGDKSVQGKGPAKQVDDTRVRGDGGDEVKEKKLGGETGIVNTTEGNLHLRDKPSMEGSVLDKFESGTVMTAHAKKGDWTKVKVWSGNKGKEGWVHSQYFLPQPDLTKKDSGEDKGNPDPYIFKKLTGKPFTGKPAASDATQGSIGDCYLIAAMGALAAQPAGQAEIMRMIQPHAPNTSYTVTFKEENWDGTFKQIPIKVDLWMPVDKGQLKYAGKGKPVADIEKAALWPYILEKAYAVWKGGYDALDKGGSPGGAMGEIAGVDIRTKYVRDFSSDEELLTAVKGAVNDGKALTAASKPKVKREFTTLKGSGVGPYSASMQNKGVPGSFKITDNSKQAPLVTDDSKGKLSSAGVGDKNAKASGTLDDGQKTYKVKVSDLKYPEGFGPKTEGDLELEYMAQYWLSDSPKICGNHAYIVEGVTEGGIKLLNPWGSYHPGEVPIKTFRECYYSFAGAELLKSEDA